MPEPLRVLIVSSEATPFAKTGGLADVIGALPPALRRRGLDVRMLLPRYGWVDRDPLTVHRRPLGVPVGAEEKWCAVLEGRHQGVPIYFLEHDQLYDRPGIYGPPGGAYDDNCLRFALLSRGALQLSHHLDWWPQVLHANDWQAALVPVYLNTVARGTPLERAASVFTIHNLAYQGWFGKQEAVNVGLPWEACWQLGLEAYDTMNILKGGILNATVVTTVSPTYAREIQDPGHGEGLDGILRSRRADLFGVLNGIDYSDWNPETDSWLPARYSASDLSGKSYCKAVLQKEAGLAPRPEVPVVGLVTRLSQQKGLDVVAAALDRLLDLDVQIVLLGSGDRGAEEFFRAASARRPDRFHAFITFDERLAHLIEAGSDFFLMPSRWEPCGLNQMYSMRYGTLPIVRETGGLRDTGTSLDPSTGLGSCFKFQDLADGVLVNVVAWAVRVYREQKSVLASMIQQAMAEDHSWARSAATYEYFYRLALVKRAGSR
jgi:starch synthase